MGKWTRRAFIGTGILAGGALVVGVGAGIAVRPGHRTPKLAKFMQGDDEVLVNTWVKLLPDNSIKIIVPHAEMGQGVHTSLPMMLADELDADWNTVSMEEAPAHEEYVNFHMAREFLYPDAIPGFVEESLTGALIKATQSMSMQVTGGSFSVRSTGARGLRVAGAALREVLVTAAAEHWQVPEDEVRVADSMLHHDASNRSEPFFRFAQAAAEIKPPQNPKLKDPSQFKLMGNEQIQRFDIPAKVDGSAKFGIDADLPGMKYATIMAAPVFGSEVANVDDAAAQNMKGVHKIVNLGDSVAVIADGYWQAKKALGKVKIAWTDTEHNDRNTEQIYQQFTDDMQATMHGGEEQEDFAAGNARGVLEEAEELISADYRVPYLAHATMEPMNCTALVKDHQAEVWLGTQNPLGVRDAVADAFEFDSENVVVHNHYLGGGFGRRAETDHPLQAIALAKQMPGVPIKLIWSREEDMQHDFYRPAVASQFKASLDDSGKPQAWEHHFMAKHEPVEAPDIPYSIANKYIHYCDSPTHIRFGPWRSVDHSQHAFFTESFIDELAVAANQDPYQYRRKLLAGKQRHLAVLDAAAKMADWGKTMPSGSGMGIAVHASFGSYVAQVAEVDVSGRKPRVNKVYCAVDAGYAVSPNALRAQMESGIIFGLTAALYGDISIKNGAVEQSNFHNYPMMRMNDAPEIEVKIINSGESMGGAGEPGTPPIAPAVCNAIYAANGNRVRELPIVKT